MDICIGSRHLTPQAQQQIAQTWIHLLLYLRLRTDARNQRKQRPTITQIGPSALATNVFQQAMSQFQQATKANTGNESERKKQRIFSYLGIPYASRQAHRLRQGAVATINSPHIWAQAAVGAGNLSAEVRSISR